MSMCGNLGRHLLVYTHPLAAAGRGIANKAAPACVSCKCLRGRGIVSKEFADSAWWQLFGSVRMMQAAYEELK